MSETKKSFLARMWKDYNLSIVLASMFILSWLGQLIFQIIEFSNQQATLGQTFKLAEFIPDFLQSTFENWQSEFLQLLTMAVLTSFLIHKGSHESKDNDEKVEELLHNIDEKLDKLIEAQNINTKHD